LDDLPAGRNKKEPQHVRLSRQPRFILSNLIGNMKGVNRGLALGLLREGRASLWAAGRPQAVTHWEQVDFTRL
jgi:hypothetical protein